MKIQLNSITRLALAAGLAAGIAGCATDTGSGSASAHATQAQGSTAPHYFVVYPKDGRLWAFGDVKTYLSYMAHGEVALTRARIGAGPGGKTVVFGITRDDVKRKQPSMGELFFDGKVTGGVDFYGEVVKNGRYHVFGEWKDFKDYMDHGEVILTFTEVGTGPKGETVVYALNKKTAKAGKPVKLIEKFKNLRGMK
ncbi:MAG: hypothetical protein AB7O31_01255 [Burkholderiales bacterium]